MSDYIKSNIGSGYNAATNINTELGKIETAIASKVDEEGGVMTGDLQMNSNDVLNAGNINTNTLTVNGVNITGSNPISSSVAIQNARIVATSGQTVFTVPTYSLGINTIIIYLNGVKLSSATDYSETNTTTITLTNGAQAGDVFEAYVGTTVTDATAYDSSLATYDQGGTGAVVTNVQAKLREFVSVKDFGAVGDGVADDSAAIQDAIDSLPANGTLYFPPTANGYYINSGILTVSTDGVKLHEPHLIYGSSLDQGGGVYPLLRIENCDNVQVLNGRFVGSGHGNINHNRRLIEIRVNSGTVDNILIQGNTFTDCPTHCIIIQSNPHTNDSGTAPTTINTKGIKIVNNDFQNSINGLLTFMGGCHDLIITGNRFKDMSTLCLKLDSENKATDGKAAGKAVISNNIFQNLNSSNSSGTVTADSAVSMEELIENVVISNNVFYDINCTNAAMVRIVGDDISGDDEPGNTILVQGNILENGTAATIFTIDRSTDTCGNLIFKDNLIRDAFSGKFLNVLSPVDNLVVEGNITQDMGADSFVLINDAVNDLRVVDNTCYGANYFLYISGVAVTNLFIKGNRIQDLDLSFLYLSHTTAVEKLIASDNDIEITSSADTSFHVFQVAMSSAVNPADIMEFRNNRISNYGGATARRAFALDVGDCDIQWHNNIVGTGYDYGVYALSAGNLYATFNYVGAGANGMRHSCATAYALGNFLETQSSAQTVGTFTAISATDITV